MEILELALPSTNIDAQNRLFSKTLGFPVERISNREIAVACGQTTLRFFSAKQQFLFHYCFLIPPGCLSSLIAFLDRRQFEPLLYSGERTVDFGNGRSVYFWDADGNIAEFIERPSLDFKERTEFSISEVICLNEIGIPSRNPMAFAQQLIAEFGIQPMAGAIWREAFVWCGDFRGVFLIPKLGRSWMPTNKPAEYNPLRVKFRTAEGVFDIRFDQESFDVA